MKSGVNSRVSTGAMFSTTLCLASTSHEATMTAPIAPQGMIHCPASHSTLIPIASNIITVKAVSTPPPSAMST